MDLKENKNDLEIEDVSKTETNFRSLYGLTPEVENAISISIENNNKQELVKLIISIMNEESTKSFKDSLFIALNLFLGSWVSRDAFKYNIGKKLTFVPLLLIYFSGPLGLILYWMIRIFYSKKLGFHE